MIFCFDIGGSAIKGGIAEEASSVRPYSRVPTPLHDFRQFVGAMREMIVRQGRELDRIAISIAAIIDPDTHRVKCANIPCLDGRDLACDLREALGWPVVIANDADCFALAETMVGAGRGHRIVFGVILGTGVGGGLVIDGKIIQGAGGVTGEWGHGPIVATSVGSPPALLPRFVCGCGQTGCVDTVGGARGLERLYQNLHGTMLSSVDIIRAWDQAEARAVRTIDCYMALVAEPLALVVNVLGASIVPVGGGLSNSLSLLSRLDCEVRQRILRQTDQPLIVPACCTVEPGLVGAGLLGFSSGEATRPDNNDRQENDERRNS